MITLQTINKVLSKVGLILTARRIENYTLEFRLKLLKTHKQTFYLVRPFE
jgi:hypothetical protein